VIEVVTQEDQDKSQARLRWKHYADRGYPLVRHDLSLKS
jgi:DNA polymerase-3 subunit chi